MSSKVIDIKSYKEKEIMEVPYYSTFRSGVLRKIEKRVKPQQRKSNIKRTWN